MPLIADDSTVQIRFKTVKENKTEKGTVLVFEYTTSAPCQSSEGGTINPGFPLFERVQLYDKNTAAGEVPDWAMKRICNRIDGFMGTADPENKKGKPARPNFSPQLIAEMVGREAFARVKVRVTPDYTGNDIVSLSYPGDVAA